MPVSNLSSATCDDCREYLDEEEATFCLVCWNGVQEDLREAQAKVVELEARVKTLTSELEEKQRLSMMAWGK